MLVAMKRAGCGLALVAVKRTVVMCGNWIIRQAMSQQVLKVTTFYMDTCLQPFATDHLHRTPRSAKIQPMSQRAAAAIRTRYTRSSCSRVACPDAVKGLCR